MPIPPMQAHLKQRLAAAQGSVVESVDPEVTIKKVVMHNAAGDEKPLRTRPDVLGVFMQVHPGRASLAAGFPWIIPLLCRKPRAPSL